MSRLRGAAAVCIIILLSFAAGHGTSYWNGNVQVANGALATDCFYSGSDDFAVKIPLKSIKKLFKIVDFLLWRQDPGFSDCGSQWMAVSRLRGATAVSVIRWSFAAGHHKSYWDGYITVAIKLCHNISQVWRAGNFPF